MQTFIEVDKAVRGKDKTIVTVWVGLKPEIVQEFQVVRRGLGWVGKVIRSRQKV